MSSPSAWARAGRRRDLLDPHGPSRLHPGGDATLDRQRRRYSARTYRPYGETLAQSGTHPDSRGWIDQRNDAETGLTYLHARYFDPQLGTFLSPDPSNPTFPGVGMNRYIYGIGDPVNGTDRSGLLKWQCEDDRELCRGYYEGVSLVVTAFITGGFLPIGHPLGIAMNIAWNTPPPGPGPTGGEAGGGGAGRGTGSGTCTGADCEGGDGEGGGEGGGEGEDNKVDDRVGCALVGNEGLDINFSFPVVPFVIPVGSVPVPAAIGFTGGIQLARDGYHWYAGPALQIAPGPALSVQRMTQQPSAGFGYALGGGGLPLPSGEVGVSPSFQINVSPAVDGNKGSVSGQGGLSFGSSRGAYVAATYTSQRRSAQVTNGRCK